MNNGTSVQFFKDDHGRTLRASADKTGTIRLALVEEETGDTVFFPTCTRPENISGMENASGFPRLQQKARACSLHSGS